MEQKPSVGRMVHYFDKDGICRAAIITDVYPDNVIDLSFFMPGEDGAHAATSIYYHEDKTLFSWHWPERV